MFLVDFATQPNNNKHKQYIFFTITLIIYNLRQLLNLSEETCNFFSTSKYKDFTIVLNIRVTIFDNQCAKKKNSQDLVVSIMSLDFSASNSQNVHMTLTETSNKTSSKKVVTHAWWHHFLAGEVGGMLGAVGCHPFDTAKVKAQVLNTHKVLREKASSTHYNSNNCVIFFLLQKKKKKRELGLSIRH
ncbi:hypothetical protein RFI_11290 [Reticulomyxa filosa]|uniref:Uncharacterized protein n=1 Tax=Reticulomyxa filosa TaxID=46433 RepID=X6NIX5_RETFI|nr:hypothetical protein RFI_11290 [Reticulomyxa filosa]|eukprot:ETO25848.1 hypothetical protein RFI_11290 [Reticulomyxa filosa]